MKNYAKKAWIVMVRTTRMSGGNPLIVGYVAATDSAIQAKVAVENHLQNLEGDSVFDVKEVSELSEDTIKSLNVHDGNVWML